MCVCVCLPWICGRNWRRSIGVHPNRKQAIGSCCLSKEQQWRRMWRPPCLLSPSERMPLPHYVLLVPPLLPYIPARTSTSWAETFIVLSLMMWFRKIVMNTSHESYISSNCTNYCPMRKNIYRLWNMHDSVFIDEIKVAIRNFREIWRRW